LLNDILAGYFCPNDKLPGLFFSEVVNDMRLSAKMAVLDKILQRDFPDFLTAYPRLRKRLDTLRIFRNRLAHAHIDTSELLSLKDCRRAALISDPRGMRPERDERRR
jgi:hypothetical protein